jgi:phospholipid/cholesterol/gamma-HCH transport system ATP-binding protein
LALDARLIFLDEPTSGLDPLSADTFDAMVKELQKFLGVTVVMITHDLGSLAMCDRIGVIVDKHMVCGTVAQIQEDPHPWIHDYFHGTRAQALLRSVSPEKG